MKSAVHMFIVTTAVVGACSTQGDGSSEAKRAAALTATSTGSLTSSSVPAAGSQIAPPVQTGASPASVALTAPPPSPQPSPAATFATSAQAATASLQTLATLVALDRTGHRGFAHASDVTSSSLGSGVPMRFVRLDHLAAFKAGVDTMKLAIDKQEIMYPILSAGVVSSSVTVQQGTDGKWQAVAFGHASTAQSSQSVLTKVVASRSVDAGTASVIDIPALHASLLSHTEGGLHMVTPLRDIPGTPYRAGVTLPASVVFATLQALAANVDPAVPN